jgi:molecular chaperone DnaK
MPQIEVTFDIDANGILSVTAQDKATGREQKIAITASTNLSKSDVEHLVGEARKHEAEDRRRREVADTRNMADSLAYQMEKTLREVGDKVSDTDRRAIENKIEEVRQAMKTDDVARIRRAMEELKQASYAMSQQMYGQPQAGYQPGGRPGPTGPADEGVVEGEFREM